MHPASSGFTIHLSGSTQLTVGLEVLTKTAAFFAFVCQHYWSEDSGIRPRSCALHRCTSFERQLRAFLFLPSLVTVLCLQRRSFNWQQWFERASHQLPIVCVLHSQKPVALETLFPREGGVRGRELDRGNCLRRHFEKR
ncbi:unnamed protein product [Sphagnum balticum]